MDVNTLFDKLKAAGVEIEPEHRENPQLLSFFTPKERLRRVKWNNEILELRTSGKMDFNVVNDIEEIEYSFKGAVSEITQDMILNVFVDDDVTCATIEESKFLNSYVKLKKGNYWQVNGKKMEGRHMYEAIYEYITGERIQIEEYSKIKSILTKMKKNR